MGQQPACFFPGLLSLQHRLKKSSELWFHFLRKVSGGKNEDFDMGRPQARILTFSLVSLEKLLDFSKSQFPHLQNADKTRLRSFCRFNVLMSIKWPAQCLMFKCMRGVCLLFPASFHPCLLAPLLVTMRTMAKLAHHSVVAPVNEGKMLRLGI